MAALWLFGGTGCQKLCQAPTTTSFKYVSDADWRLTASTDPQVSVNLTNYTFLIWHFDTTFGGTITAVQNNQKFDVPVKTFTYKPDASSGTMQITFYGQGTADANGNATQGQSEGTTVFQYNLSTKLTLYDTQRAYEYDFVQFTGSVAPDADCTF